MLITDLRSIIINGNDVIAPEAFSRNEPSNVCLIFSNFARRSIPDTDHTLPNEKHWPVIVREGDGNTFEGKFRIKKEYGEYILISEDSYSPEKETVTIRISQETFNRFIKALYS